MKLPKPKTSLNRSRPKKARKHLPAFSQVQRDLMQMQMAADARIPPAVNRAVMASLNSAANPNAESPEVVIQTLDIEERLNVQSAMQGYQQTLSGVGARGRNAMMFDSSIDDLVNSEDENGD